MFDVSKFNLKANHGLNVLFLGLGAAWVLYNHFSGQGLVPIKLEEFAPLAPMLGQWWTSVQAGNAPSTKFITPAQIVCAYDLAAERGIDLKQLAAGAFQKELETLTAREASCLIADYLKSIAKKATAQ